MAGEDRTVVVTGGARGIGRGIADALLEAGTPVGVIDLTTTDCDDSARLHSIDADVSDAAAVDAAFDTIESALGPIGGLVNNAGVIELGPALDSSPESWDAQIKVNVEGTFTASRAIARRWIDAGSGGSIVNVASNAGKVGYPNMAAYNATKAAVINLTRSLAAEWAEHDINVNAVCPGGVDTPMLMGVAEWFAERFGGDAHDIHAGMVPSQLGRHIEPIEIGRVVRFLLSEDARIIRGQSINADGGDTPY